MNKSKKVIFIILILLVLLPIIPNTLAYSQQSSYQKTPAQSNYEKYNGTIYHIFFHSLILDTHKAFTSSKKSGYNMWMTTREEFKSMLPLLYQKNFVLVDLTNLIQKNADGTISQQDLYLPKGKKPLVISVDDVNYYEYMKNHGFATRLALDDRGKVCNIVTNNGVEIFDYEGDVVPILDSFLEKYPDFSPFGAKGILAVTGYEGVFGYRTTTLTGEEKQNATQQASEVADALKATGWRLACHSYTHSQKFYDGNIPLADLKDDTQRWKREIGKIVGDTILYITPFGCHFSLKEERIQYLKEEGFAIICPVYKEMTVHYSKDFMISNRLNFDGLTMLKYPERIEKYFFDPALVLDTNRHNIII